MNVLMRPRRFLAFNRLRLLVLLVGSVPMLASCWSGGSSCFDCEPTHRAVYLDYETLRSSVRVVDAEPIETLNRLYLYDAYIFLVDKNRGIHVLDNLDATNPVNVAYVEVPGATEISIRDGFLYVDSYVDLVTLDARNPRAIVEVDREEGIFPWDAYQNIGNRGIWLEDPDPEKGVVIGYEEI